MCGIAGILSSSISNNRGGVTEMAQALYHRGPDMGDSWENPQAGIALSHRRLSILDLSVHGAQPMTSNSGRYVLTYNGEIYNYLEIRRKLETHHNYTWQGHSDTEVLLSALETWGISETLEKTNGMFAFGLWDKKTRTLTLARDRFGEKPLYLGWLGKKIVFASELKAFQCIPQWQKNIDNEAVGYLLRFGFIPAPLSIYQGIYKLPAAHFISFSAKDTQRALDVSEFQEQCTCYWNLSSVAHHGIDNPFDADENTAIEVLNELLSESVRKRMLADVPVGALLSGGIDSSLVTAIMQKHSPRPVQTFTVGFREDRFDEAKFSKNIANYLHSDHTEIILSPEDALAIIPQLPSIYNEPLADPSQIPTALVAKIARRKVTVALSGDGGDELFSGYARYHSALKFWPLLRLSPSFMRSYLGRLTNGNNQLTRLFHSVNTSKTAFRIWRLSRRISAGNFQDYYGNLLALSLSRTATKPNWPSGLPLYKKHIVPNGLDTEQQMMFIDQMSYLPDDILVKTDRASMAASLELRIPLLDHTIAEFAWRMPAGLRRRKNTGKYLLHQLLYRYIPRELVDRPKKGFDIPLDSWLRGPLREWMLDLLSPETVKNNTFLETNQLNFLVDQHLSGHGDFGYTLWPVLMLQAWRCHQK